MDQDPGIQPDSMPNQPGAPQSHRIYSAGENFANYRVVRCISAGLLVNYYEMQHVRDLEAVTVGVLHPRTRNQPKLLKRLQMLQQQSNGLDHEGIPKIRDCCEMKGAYCIFYDPVEGTPLSRYFAEQREAAQAGITSERLPIYLHRCWAS